MRMLLIRNYSLILWVTSSVGESGEAAPGWKGCSAWFMCFVNPKVICCFVFQIVVKRSNSQIEGGSACLVLLAIYPFLDKSKWFPHFSCLTSWKTNSNETWSLRGTEEICQRQSFLGSAVFLTAGYQSALASTFSKLPIQRVQKSVQAEHIGLKSVRFIVHYISCSIWFLSVLLRGGLAGLGRRRRFWGSSASLAMSVPGVCAGATRECSTLAFSTILLHGCGFFCPCLKRIWKKVNWTKTWDSHYSK